MRFEGTDTVLIMFPCTDVASNSKSYLCLSSLYRITNLYYLLTGHRASVSIIKMAPSADIAS